ncbi:MAG: tyrosine-type recombinase/integrase [Methylocella sp.]
MPLDQISNDDVAKLVSWRRSQTVKGRTKKRGKEKPRLIAPATVNRSTIEPLQKMFTRASKVWRVVLRDAPDWGQHLLREPTERVREVRGNEEGAIQSAVRSDYLPLISFARAAGLRQAECLLKKDDIDLLAGRIRTIGKGKKPIDHPITSEMRAILMAEMANPTEYVFTYAAARARKKHPAHERGQRMPITASGLKTLWRRAKHRRSGPSVPADLRFHDLRHDFATKLLRETKNLKLVQKALHHSKIETTTKYAHVLDDEVLEGMEAAGRKRTGKPEA